MKRRTIISVLLFLSFHVFSQQVIFEKEITLKSGFKDKRESLPVVNDEKKEILLFLLDNAEINVLRFNDAYELTDNYTSDRPQKTYKTLLGHSIDNKGYHLYFTNEKKNRFYVKSFDVNNKLATGNLIIADLKNEKFLESVSYNDKFYLLSIKKFSSILKILVVQGNQITEQKELDLSSYKFSDSGFPKLFDVLLADDGSPFSNFLKIHKIDNGNPNPLDLTTKANKIYYDNNHIYLTLDNELRNTKIIAISLHDLNCKVDYINQLKIDCGDSYRIKSNSYLYNDLLYQIKVCNEELCFRIFNLADNRIIKEYRVKSNEDIYFRNTPLVQEGGTTIFHQDMEKELDKTRQALRKIAGSDVGISVFPSPRRIELTIGGYKEIKNTGGGGGMVMTSPGMTMATPHGTISTPPTYHYNPTMYGYSTYAHTRSVYFKTLLDRESFDHTPGTMDKNVFDRIRDYEKKYEDNLTSETIFRYKNYYVFGYYNKTDRKYYLVKFRQ